MRWNRSRLKTGKARYVWRAAAICAVILLRPSLSASQSIRGSSEAVLKAAEVYGRAQARFEAALLQAAGSFQRLKDNGPEVFRSIEAAQAEIIGQAVGQSLDEIVKKHGPRLVAQRALLNVVSVVLVGKDIYTWAKIDAQLIDRRVQYEITRLGSLKPAAQELERAGRALDAAQAVRTGHQENLVGVTKISAGEVAGYCMPSWSGPTQVEIQVVAGGVRRRTTVPCIDNAWRMSNAVRWNYYGLIRAYAVLLAGSREIAASSVASGS